LSWKPLIDKYGFKKGARQTAHVRQELDGYSFASGLERDTYLHLKLLKTAVEISEIKCQVTINITKYIRWRVDFECKDIEGNIFYVEAKGYPTEVYELKKKLYKEFGKYPLYIYVRHGKDEVTIKETVFPENAYETLKR